MIKWPTNPKIGDIFWYSDPFGSSDMITFEYKGIDLFHPTGWWYIGSY